METVKEIVMRLSPMLRYYSECRMPYTYHHDQMRKDHPSLYESRADVALAFRGADDDHFFSIAFYNLLSSVDGVDVVNCFGAEDLQDAYRIVNIAEVKMAKC